MNKQPPVVAIYLCIGKYHGHVLRYLEVGWKGGFVGILMASSTILT